MKQPVLPPKTTVQPQHAEHWQVNEGVVEEINLAYLRLPGKFFTRTESKHICSSCVSKQKGSPKAIVFYES